MNIMFLITTNEVEQYAITQFFENTQANFFEVGQQLLVHTGIANGETEFDVNTIHLFRVEAIHPKIVLQEIPKELN